MIRGEEKEQENSRAVWKQYFCPKCSLAAMRSKRCSQRGRRLPPDACPPAGRQPVVRIKTPEDEGCTSWKELWLQELEVEKA